MFERYFERMLWGSRLIFVVASLACLAIAAALLWISALDAWHALLSSVHYADPALVADVRKTLRIEIVGEAVKALDGFLLAMAVMIFAFGIYELFVSEIDDAQGHHQAGHLLVVKSLEDLKARLGKVILVIMVVTLFEGVLEFHPGSGLDLLELGGAIVLAAGALYLSHVEH